MSTPSAYGRKQSKTSSTAITRSDRLPKVVTPRFNKDRPKQRIWSWHLCKGLVTSWRSPISMLLCAVVLLPFLTACGPTDQVEQALRDASTAVYNVSSDWQAALENLKQELIKQKQDILANEIPDIITRAQQAAASNVKCILDFLRSRIGEDLSRLWAEYHHQAVPDRQPIVCTTAPDNGIQMSRDPNERNTVLYEGYNFDTSADNPIRAYLREGTVLTDVTLSLTHNTHYHMLLNLGQNGVHLDFNSNALLLKWKDQVLSEVPVIQPFLPTCQSKAQTIDLNDPRDYTPPLQAGDKDFYGNGPEIRVGARMRADTHSLQGSVYMWAMELGGDHSYASGESTFTLFTADPDWIISRIVSPPSLSDDLPQYTENDHSMKTVERSDSGIVKRYEIWGDHGGEDIGDYTHVRVYFNRVTVELQQVSNCTATGSPTPTPGATRTPRPVVTREPTERTCKKCP